MENFFIPQPLPTGATKQGPNGQLPTYKCAGFPSEMMWSGKMPLPAIGDRIYITMNSIGPAIVKGYFESEGYVGVMTLALNPPKWLQDQRKREAKDPRYMSKPTWVKEGIGCEFGTEILPIQWLTFAPSGKSHTHSADDGVTGWRLHAIAATDKTTMGELGRKAAICGRRPKTGWNLDLFIEQKCSRCEKALGLLSVESERYRASTVNSTTIEGR
jgi:hypothetical protein